MAWVSLEAGDDEPARFLLYVISAIGTVHEDFGEDARTFS